MTGLGLIFTHFGLFLSVAARSGQAVLVGNFDRQPENGKSVAQ